MSKKIIFSFMVLALGVLPASAKINGSISKNHFYDTQKTIMTDIFSESSIRTEKYWEKNMLYNNKYRPFFMLSNKELNNFSMERKPTFVQRVTTPSVYNISFKTSSIKTVSFATPPALAKAKQNGAKLVTKPAEVKPKHDTKAISLYEQAKNPGVDSETKIETAIKLQESKNLSNYILAIDLLDDVTKQEPYNAYAYYVKGELYLAKKDSENAMKNYVEALKLNPYSKQSCLGIAKILEPTNKELSQKYYDRANQ